MVLRFPWGALQKVENNRMKCAAVMLGMCGVLMASAVADAAPPKHYGDVMRWYETAAQAGDAEAQFLLGMQYESGVRAQIRTGTATPEMDEAVRWYRAAAEQGNAQAQLRLGDILFEGRGVARDLPEAVRWYRAAAGKGSGRAAYNLALMERQGFGVAADPASAAKWYVTAFERGVARAALDLAVMYANGDGVERDPVQAMAWLTAADKAGVTGGDAVRAALAAELSDAEKAEAAKRAAALGSAK